MVSVLLSASIERFSVSRTIFGFLWRFRIKYFVKDIYDSNIGKHINLISSLRAKPGAALQTPLSFINSLTDSFCHPLVKTSLQRHHAKTVKKGASSHKTNYIEHISEILNLEGHLNCCIGSKVSAILMNGWILITGGVASGRVYNADCAAGLLFSSVFN